MKRENFKMRKLLNESIKYSVHLFTFQLFKMEFEIFNLNFTNLKITMKFK